MNEKHMSVAWGRCLYS